eukprot:UN25980
MAFYSHTQNSRSNAFYAYMCDSKVHTTIKRIWVLTTVGNEM